jgi:Flp pilus assembly protein TadD
VALVERDPESSTNWLRLGMVYQANLQYDLARQVYGRVLEIEPTSAQAHYYLALCHNRLGDTTAAIVAMARVTVHDPTYVPAWWHLGLWQMEMGDLEEAERSARRVADDPAGGVVLARVLLQKGARDEAVELLERLVTANPGDRHAHMLLGTAYRQLGRTEDARRELNLGRGEILERPDPWAEVLQQFFSGVAADRKRADSLLKQGRFEEAIAILEALHAQRPNNVSVIGHLAVAHRQAGQVARSRSPSARAGDGACGHRGGVEPDVRFRARPPGGRPDEPWTQ